MTCQTPSPEARMHYTDSRKKQRQTIDEIGSM